MKIRELSIKNCLSFCDKGLNANNSIQLADFNLFIGSNNAGKSNVLKLMEILRLAFFSIHRGGNETLQNISLASGELPIDWLFTRDETRTIDFTVCLEIEQADQAKLNIQPYRHDEDRDPVSFMFGVINDLDSWPKALTISALIKYTSGEPFVTVNRIEIPTEHSAYREEPIIFDRKTKKVLALRPRFQGSEEKYWTVVQHHDEDQWGNEFAPVRRPVYKFLDKLGSLFKDLFINIRAIREIKPLGDEVVEALSRLRDGAAEEIELHNSVIDYIKTLIFVDESQEILFLYPGQSGNRQVKIQIGGLQLPLSHYGSAVEQMLAMATKIVQHGSNKIVLIEEPEAHFHPDLQRKFVSFLKEDQQMFAHQYLMATHSNVFINEFINMGGNVFHVYFEQDEKNKAKYSQVEPFSKESALNLFMELGIKPSDLLLANGILVVEGRIDKEVYTDWAKKIGKPFENIGLEVIDVTGAGNISKYLGSYVIQRTCFKNYGLCDKNQEKNIRTKLQGIVPDKNIIALGKGDLEDYYPRRLVMDFAKEWGKIKNKEKEIPNRIKVGETVQVLDNLFGELWWKPKLEAKIIQEMKPDEIDDEVKSKLTQIYDSIY